MQPKGWHSRGYLPHCDAAELVQHVVFRLADSLPASVVQALSLLGKAEQLKGIDAALDAGAGASVLADPEAAQIVVDTILWFDRARYVVHAWCVMPNHVHVVMQPLTSLGTIVKSWKAFSAAKINRLAGRSGRLWAPDYFDRFMRNDDQLAATIFYVEANPVAARLSENPEAWPFSSAGARWRAKQERA